MSAQLINDDDATPVAMLLTRARNGDRDAFERAVYLPYERQIYSHAYRLMVDADDAYDLTVDCFVKAYTRLGTLRPPYNVSAWLHRIATNLCLDKLRRRQRLRWLPWEGPKHDHLLVSEPADDPERAAVSREAQAIVRRVLNRLSARDRTLLVLREYQALSCQEIGERMGMSRSAIKSALFRARATFRIVYAAIEAERVKVQNIA